MEMTTEVVITPQTRQSPGPIALAVTLVVVAVLALWIGYGYLTWRILDTETAGRFGDMYGAFNAFFGSVASLLLVLALLLQREQIAMQAEELRLQRTELRYQRDEMERNREELSRSASAQERTENLIRKQLLLLGLSSYLAAEAHLPEEYTPNMAGFQTSSQTIRETRRHIGDILNQLGI